MSDSHLIPPGVVIPGEIISVSAVVGTIMGYLPPLAALMAIVWYCVLLYDRFQTHKLIVHKP